MSEIILQLPDAILKRLQFEANQQHVQIGVVVLDALQSYLDDREPNQEELLNDLRQSMTNALAGHTHPAAQLLDELRQKYSPDDYHS